MAGVLFAASGSTSFCAVLPGVAAATFCDEPFADTAATFYDDPTAEGGFCCGVGWEAP